MGKSQSHLINAKFASEQWARVKAFLIKLGLMLLGAVLLGWLITQRRRSARRALEARGLIQQWERLLQRVGDNLVKFEDEHALLLSQPGLMERFDETSTGPVAAMAREVDNLFLSFEAAHRVLSAAQDVLAQAGRLRWLRERPYERAIELLTIQEIAVRSEELTYRKPYLPRKEEVRMRPQQLLADIQASWERAVHLVDKLEERFRASWEKLDQLNRELGELESLELRLVELGIPSPLKGELETLEREAQSARETAKTDPEGAMKEAASLEQSVSRLRHRIEPLLQAATRVSKDVREIRAEARAALEQLHAEGFVVEEPGFEPSTMLAHIDQLSAAAMRAVKAGDMEAAEKRASEALESAVELLDLCGRLRRSREESLGRIVHLEQRCQALRERIPERRERLRGLRQAHADSALRPALDNVEEASAVLGQVDRHLAEARTCMAPGTQRYLGAEELIRRASEQLAAVDALFQEIETQAAELAQARQEAEKELAADAWPFEAMKALLMDAPTADAGTRAVHEKAMQGLSELRSAAQAERPDWRRLRAHVMALRTETQATVQRAMAEYEAYQRTEQLQDLSNRLAEEKQPDRAERARKALAAADTALRDANKVYGAGVTADLSEAQRCFSVALAHLKRQDYGAASQAAEQVRQEVRKAMKSARAKAAVLEQKRYEAPADRDVPDLWPATLGVDRSGSSPGRPSLGSSSGRSGFGGSSSRRGK
jgi:chromosome segregation ATPase